ncbi:MAG TPA: sulfotransferase domain-containing protein [Sphingomicrobium sp.]|jgi:hypothetical protein|nr:sulfotransferase domain-containing protein [Sphingomicrobium sp.]
MKPNLFIVGAPKCGTTAWAEYLGSHPDIFFSEIKEPHHFATDRDSELRIADRADYLRLFARRGAAKVLGEASVTYLLSEVAARNIHAFNPDAKILIFLRNQEDYLPSRHNQLVFNGVESITDFEQAWRLSGRRDATNAPAFFKHPELLDYRAAGAFGPQVERYYALFPEDQIRVFHFDNWTEQSRQTYLEILRFLGIPDDGRTDFPPVHQARHHATKFVVKFVRQPPRIVRLVVALIKKLTRRSGLGLANWLIELDSRPGTLSQISDELRREIRDFYEKDNEKLQRRIWSAPPDA